MTINTKEYWDEIWKREGSNTWRVYPDTIKHVTEIIKSDKRVLELGCGVGILAKKLVDQHNYVFGIDISAEAIRIMEKDFCIPGMAAKVPPIPTDIKFDYVIAAEFLEHFEDTREILKEMARVAEYAIIIVPDNVLGPEECAEHHQKYDITSLTEELSNYWKCVLVYRFVDVVKNGNNTIILPNLLAYCKGGKT